MMERTGSAWLMVCGYDGGVMIPSLLGINVVSSVLWTCEEWRK